MPNVAMQHKNAMVMQNSIQPLHKNNHTKLYIILY